MADTVSLILGGSVVATKELGKETLVFGRAKDANLVINDPGAEISRYHGKVTRIGSSYWVEDTSMNGVMRDGARIEQQVKVTNGLRLRVGSHTLLFLVQESTKTDPFPLHTEAIQADPWRDDLLAPLRSEVPVWADEKERVALRLIERIDQTPDICTFRFSGVDKTLFSFKPGQSIALHAADLPSRRYTISSSPARPYTLEITVKRKKDGYVSVWLHDHLTVGMEVVADGPYGDDFSCVDIAASKYLFLGIGSGITPVMSMIRWIADTGHMVDVKFLVGARSEEDIPFRRELVLLNRNHRRFDIQVALSRPANQLTGRERPRLRVGRMTAPMLLDFCPDIAERQLFLCGPEPVRDAIEGMLPTLGVDSNRFHTEAFGGAGNKPPQEGKGEGKTYELKLAKSGKSVQVSDGKPVLASLKDWCKASDESIKDLQYQCEVGFCFTCPAKLLTGKVLEADPKKGDKLVEEGKPRLCISYPRSNLTLDL